MHHHSPSPTEIQSHLYQALLSSSTTDVALHVSGSWSAVYHVHRVVLIQSGFFHSLFTSGFAETPQDGKAPNKVDVTFDDENITRAAFEICLARLYGGGPPLFISPSLVPSSAYPLTPSFGTGWIPEKTPANHHPATPRFLLSLLATAFYLSIPSVQSQAYSQILATIGPYTAISYLNFALGHRISDLGPDEPEAAVGLEQLANIHISDDIIETSLQSTKGDDTDEDISRYDTVLSRSSSLHSEAPPTKCFHYGVISDKIGESVSCWLTRWALDLLDNEDSPSDDPSGNSSGPPLSRPRSYTLPAGPIKERKGPPPCIFRRGGLSAEWISVLVSSDTLFVKNEWERYKLAKRIVELRRQSSVDPHEERHWSKMFSQGIFYVNMTNDELITVSQDRSPATQQPYVPLKVLQAALWDQGALRHKIVSKPGVPPPCSPVSREKEVGLVKSTASILSEVSSESPVTESQADVMFYPIPPDATCRYGEIGKVDDFPTSPGPEGQPSLPNGKKIANRKNFFGIQLARHNASACISSDATGKERWTPYPPYRFSIEFWDAVHLKEKSRLHSQTIWHAGSLFNVYVQIVRKKGIQLGVYLHRQSTVDPIPPISAPFSPQPHSNNIHVPSRSETWQAPSRTTSPTIPSSSLPSAFHYSPSIHPTSRSSTPNVSSPRPTTSPTPSLPALPSVTPAMPFPQPYRDPRSEISAYFSIDVSSAYGSSFTRFTSAPDLFKISQSWGWKSSASRTEEYLAGLNEKGEPATGISETNKLLSLRATIVVGIV